jgi:hypothetical protein
VGNAFLRYVLETGRVSRWHRIKEIKPEQEGSTSFERRLRGVWSRWDMVGVLSRSDKILPPVENIFTPMCWDILHLSAE